MTWDHCFNGLIPVKWNWTLLSPWFKPKPGSGAPIHLFLLMTISFKKWNKSVYSIGIMFDSKLQWGSQINYICKKGSYYLYLLSSHLKSLTFDTLKLLAESLMIWLCTSSLRVSSAKVSSLSSSVLAELSMQVTKSLQKYYHIYNSMHMCNALPGRRIFTIGPTHSIWSAAFLSDSL